MDFTETLIKDYSKKIFGFAYLKTNDYHNAEDLSQDIITALCDRTIAYKGIENMDAYIYRICCYSWSKYLRKNKPEWKAQSNTSAFDYMESDDNIEQSLIQKELYDKLKQEIMYLSKTKREITIQFYYENKSGEEISKILGIPASTVRWHLSQAKINLKERIQMTEQNGIYKPIRLCTGRNGWGQNYDPCGLDTDVLMQNICWICHGNALTMEEISRMLGVAAIYIEDKVEKLLYMDYLKTVCKNKYQTNFFIPDAKYQLADRRFHVENTLPMAQQFYRVIHEALPQIKKTAFDCADFDDDYLIWQLISIVIFRTIQQIDNDTIQSKRLHHACPKRKDGSKHWACVSVRMSDILEKADHISDELHEFCMQTNGNKIKAPFTDTMHALQFDLGFVGGYRDFGPIELSQLRRVHEIIINNKMPNDYDKEIISNLISKGYVSNTDQKLKILIPYFTAVQMQAVNDILRNCSDELLNKTEIQKTFNEYICTMNKEIPAFVDENERNHLLTGYSPYITILWLLYKNGSLHKLTSDEKTRICTIVWEK